MSWWGLWWGPPAPTFWNHWWVPRLLTPETKNNNASRIQNAVWSCSGEVKRIFCVGMWQWMKHRSTSAHPKQKYRQLSGQQLVKAVQRDHKLNSGLARLWQPYSGTRMVSCLSTILRKVKPLTMTITWHYWIDWAQKSRKTASHAKENSAVPPRQCIVPQVHGNDGQIEWIMLQIASLPTIFSRSGPQRLLALCSTEKNAPGKEKKKASKI